MNITPEKTNELREIIKEMAGNLERSIDNLESYTFDELIELGKDLAIDCELLREDDESGNWVYTELIEGDINEDCPFNPNNLPNGRKWYGTAAEAFNAISQYVIGGEKKSFRFRRNLDTDEIIQIMYG